MTKKEMNELADLIVDKLLTTYIREQATWYTTSSMDDIYNTFKKSPKKTTCDAAEKSPVELNAMEVSTNGYKPSHDSYSR